MNCKAIQQNLIFYLDRELLEEKHMAMEGHLKICVDCREQLAFLKAELQIIAEEKNPEVSPFFYTRLSARFDDIPQSEIPKLRNRILQPAFFSLILLVAIFGGVQLGSNASSEMITATTVTNGKSMIDDFAAEPIENFLLNADYENRQ